MEIDLSDFIIYVFNIKIEDIVEVIKSINDNGNIHFRLNLNDIYYEFDETDYKIWIRNKKINQILK